jgi:hypothetical protein
MIHYQNEKKSDLVLAFGWERYRGSTTSPVQSPTGHHMRKEPEKHIFQRSKSKKASGVNGGYGETIKRLEWQRNVFV